MDDYLLRYAIDKVWQNPTQDKQFVYNLQKLTPRYGVRDTWVVEYQRYYMPTNRANDFYHIYQIGSMIPSNLGLPKVKDRWISMKTLAKDYLTLAEAYVTSGIRFPMDETYVLITQSQNMLVAVKINDRYPSLDDNTLYFHCYHNAYFSTERASERGDNWIQVDTIIAAGTDAIRQMQIAILDTIDARGGGFPQYFVNGKAVDEISILTAQGGDYCEFILDPSIKAVYEFPLFGLPVFNSSLDKQRKYILHYPGAQVEPTIDFYDDIEIFLCKRGQRPNVFQGTYFQHNEGIWARQLTHRDYSVPVARTAELLAENDFLGANDRDKFFRVYIRRSGNFEELIADANRIEELYKLTDQQIINLMTGADSTNPLWRADALEKTAYVQFMSADVDVIYPITFNEPELNSEGKVEAQNFAGEVFGYHEVAHLLNDNPAMVFLDPTDNLRKAKLAYNFWRNATVFEYNQTGVLLGYHYHVGGEEYYIRDQSTYMVECVTGEGSENLHGSYGNEPVNLTGGYGWRVYVTAVWAGVPTNEWIDITDRDDRANWGYFDSTLGAERWVWTADPKAWYGYVRTDRYFYLKEMRFTEDTGIIRFAIDNWEDHAGDSVNRLMAIPMGEKDVFFNNYSMIHGLDYTSNDIYTVLDNLEHRNVGGINTVLVRCTGFCTPDLKYYPPAELGFVEYGVLSNDATYQLHSHKVQRIVVDGHYKAPQDIVFAEDTGGHIITSERNGAPFQIQTPQVVFRNVFTDDYEARVEDDLRDKYTQDAMSYYFPKVEHTYPDTFVKHYAVYSAFSNKILKDIQNGLLKPPIVNGRYNDMDVARVIKPYEWLVPLDILNSDYNTNHVRVYPHWDVNPIGLERDQYDFYMRVIKMYLQRPLDTAPFIYLIRT